MATITSTRRPNATVGARKPRKPDRDPAWREYERLLTGLHLSDMALVQQRFEDEVARCEAAGAARVAAGEKLDPITLSSLSILRLSQNINGDHDKLRYATWADHVTSTFRRLLEVRSTLGLKPGPLRPRA